MILSMFNGIISVFLFFISSVVITVGIKVVINRVKRQFTPKPDVKKRTVKKPKTIRSISINPEEVDRIYVKKVS